MMLLRTLNILLISVSNIDFSQIENPLSLDKKSVLLFNNGEFRDSVPDLKGM